MRLKGNKREKRVASPESIPIHLNETNFSFILREHGTKLIQTSLMGSLYIDSNYCWFVYRSIRMHCTSILSVYKQIL